MKPVSLRHTPIVASPIGLGCVNLTMHDDPRSAVALLEEAFALGVTHFDVARLYGFGQAEGILGGFLQGKRDRVTVTTKFGLNPPAGLAKRKGLVSFARKMAHRFKFVAAIARRSIRVKVGDDDYSPTSAVASLDTSLRELKTDYVDCFQLHDCNLHQANREDLIAQLELEVTKGRIRCFGIGAVYPLLQGDAGLFPKKYSVLQFDSDVANRQLEKLPNIGDRGIITFSVIRLARTLAATAKANPALTARYRDRVGADLSDVSAIVGLLLRHAAFVNPNGIALFATTRLENLRSNVRWFEKLSASSEQMTAFGEFAREAVSTAPTPAAL